MCTFFTILINIISFRSGAPWNRRKLDGIIQTNATFSWIEPRIHKKNRFWFFRRVDAMHTNVYVYIRVYLWRRKTGILKVKMKISKGNNKRIICGYFWQKKVGTKVTTLYFVWRQCIYMRWYYWLTKYILKFNQSE